jgi:uncharacterized protein YxjI
MLNTTFFSTGSYFIDQKVNFFKFGNLYNIYNDKGEKIGLVNQQLTGWQKVLRLLLKQAMLPFFMEIRNADEQIEAVVKRGWTFFMSTITIANQEGMQIGIIKQKFKLFKPTFIIFDASGSQTASIVGNWTAWDFVIKNESDVEIGKINKKWAGAAKEIFTTADKYNVSFDYNYQDPTKKILALSGAICIDMVFKNNK